MQVTDLVVTSYLRNIIVLSCQMVLHAVDFVILSIHSPKETMSDDADTEQLSNKATTGKLQSLKLINSTELNSYRNRSIRNLIIAESMLADQQAMTRAANTT